MVVHADVPTVVHGLRREPADVDAPDGGAAVLEPELIGRLVQALSPREVVELLLTAGVYEALAKLMNALGLESEGPITAEFAAAVNRGAVSRDGE